MEDININYKIEEDKMKSGKIKRYIDGTKINNKTGCAFVISEEQNKEIYNEIIKISNDARVFQAQALTIRKAINCVNLCMKDKRIRIISDSNQL